MKNKKTKEQTLPKWFKGLLYTNSETVTNKFSGECYELTGTELSMYDFIMGTQWQMEITPKMVTPEQVSDFHKALSWFRRNNAAAYMALLD